nr:ThuA domain-containing protein [Pedobacter panaciterrae]
MKILTRNNSLVKALTMLSLILIMFSAVSASAKKNPRILVFCKTAGFHHDAIKVGTTAIFKLGAENNFDVDTTTNSEKFTAANLKNYKAVVFLNTTGDVLNDTQQAVFEKYIQGGGNFVGVHAATDTEYDWPWYGKLVGAYFVSHPNQQEATLNVVNRNHISTKHLPEVWKRKDEWYNFKWVADGLNVLIYIDEKSYDAGNGKMGDKHPMAWYHEYDGGRAFYTELGHTDESYSDPLYLQHLLGGIKYALGVKK